MSAQGVAIVDMEQELNVIDVIDEKDEEGVRKHCFNSTCDIFGIISSNSESLKFVQKHPEFIIKKRNVLVKGVIMDIIERIEFMKNKVCPICFITV